MGAKVIVQMTAAKTTLLDPSGAVAPKEFTFDYSYWSFDSSAPNFATNPKVYSDLGVSVLNNAWSGYNCCLFAYGQTGSGKSYSMVGYGEDKGIVPQAMEEMFDRIAKNKDKNIKYMVEASMMEIYNEKVKDLFNPDSGDRINGLKVRDNPQTGPYVEDLSRSVITSFKEFENLLGEGNAVRTVAATQMNATSSRAHTVFQIVFTTTTHDVETNKSSNKTSKINLVDLAGSERLSKTGASGQQMKEGIGINKSLTALGNCIEKLAKKSQVKKGGKEVHVPYRDSVLTWLLKESLGGNAKTIMIAAISPADDNYEESLSTLRYADRAKQIKNSAVVNEDENGKIIRELKKEIQALRDALAKGGAGAGPAASEGMSDKEKEDYLALKEQMKQNEDLVARMNMSWEEKMKESEEMAAKRAAALYTNTPAMEEKKKRLPHMVNLHKDKLMSECLSYFFPPGVTRLVTKAADPPPGEDDIILSGLQIKPNHALAEHDEKTHSVWMTPGDGARVFVNGKLIKERTEINHNDRLICGAHLVFRFIFPNHATDDQDSIFDWEYANKELTTSTIEALNKPDEETLKAQAEQAEKLARMQAEIEAERVKAKADQEARQREYEAHLKEIAKKKEAEIAATKLQIEQSSHAESQKALAKKLAEREAELERERAAAAKQHSERLEAMKKEQAALEAKLQAQQNETKLLHKKHEVEKRDRQLLEENLMHCIPLVNEANAICTELGQPLRYSLKLEAKRSLDDDGFTEHTDIWVRVVNLEDDLEVLWDVETLTEALYTMREIYNGFMRSGEIVIPKNREENPFHLVPNGPMLIGTARLYLQPCFFLLPIHESTAIIDYRGEHKGQLYVNLIPIPPRDEDTMNLKEEELFFEEEELPELKGEPLSMRLEVKKCMGLPQRYSRNVHVAYKFFYDSSEHKSEVAPDAPKEGTINPMINYERQLLVEIITDEFVEYIKNGILEFSVYGEQPIVEREDDDEEEEEKNGGSSSSSGGGGKSVKSGDKRRSGAKGASAKDGGSGSNERLAKLESVLRDITAQVDPATGAEGADRLLKESPEAISAKVAALVTKQTNLEAEVVVLKSPEKQRPVRPSSAIEKLEKSEAENAKIKAELESFKAKKGAASRAATPANSEAASSASAEETAALKAELEALRSASASGSAAGAGGASAAELAELRAAHEADERALAELRASMLRMEKEAEDLRELQAKEAQLNQELQARLSTKTLGDSDNGGDEQLAQLRRELESARAKAATSSASAASGRPADDGLASMIARKDAELAEVRRALKEEQEKKKKSSACVIL